MKSSHKVAIVSRGSTAYFNRLMLGALSFSDAESNLITRDFRFPLDYQDFKNPDLIPTWKQLHQWNPDGLLCILESELLESLLPSLPRGQPVVNMLATNPALGIGVVAGSQAAWIGMAVRHMRHQGLRSIAYLEVERSPSLAARFEQFKQIARPEKPAEACFLEVTKLNVLEDPFALVAPVPPRLAAWLQHLPKPTGVICPSTGGGGYLIRVCNALGLRVPADIAVIGVDDTDLANASTPPLTTVLLAAQQIGRTAMELLDQMMHGKPAPKEPVRIEAMDLHVRESTGLNRAEICDIAAALGYISQHACQGITVEQLLKETQHVSKGTFLKYFQAATGQTPSQAIQLRQLEEAKRLLADTLISLTAIAECCGYCNSSSFARSFGALAGITPRDYRKQARGKRPRKK
jgi:LacI family transcriptional regulator